MGANSIQMFRYRVLFAWRGSILAFKFWLPKNNARVFLSRYIFEQVWTSEDE